MSVTAPRSNAALKDARPSRTDGGRRPMSALSLSVCSEVSFGRLARNGNASTDIGTIRALSNPNVSARSKAKSCFEMLSQAPRW